jgi:hypothetical protein
LDFRNFLFLPLLHWSPIGFSAVCCSVSMCLNIFWGFFVLLHCDLVWWRGLFQFSWMCWDLLCVLKYDLVWRKFLELQRRMCIA